MALTLVKQPPIVSLFGNDILFRINTDNQYEWPGVKAIYTLEWSEGDAILDHFNISFNYESIDFVCAAEPDGSGEQYKAYVSGSLADWVEEQVEYFKANYLLSRDYDISFNPVDSKIYLEARNTGSVYNPVLSTSSSNVTLTENTEGEDATLRELYEMMVRVWLNTGSEFEIIGEDRRPVDEDGNVNFFIQDYFKPFFDFLFTWPEESDNLIVQQSLQKKAFYIEYAEFYDEKVRRLYPTSGATTYVMPGMISRHKVAEINADESTWWDKWIVGKDFLTYQPQSMVIGQTQPVKCFFIVWKPGVTSVKLYLVKTNRAGDGAPPVAKFTISASQYDILECIFSFLKLGYELGSTDVDHYEVYLTDQDNNRISTSRYYYPDYRNRPDEHIFLFRNSLGCPDTVRFTGVSVEEQVIDSEVMTMNQEDDFTDVNRDVRNFLTTETQAFKFNTGWMNGITKDHPRLMADYMREFFLSEEIYEVINNRLYAVRLTSKKQIISKTDERLIAMEFEAERAYTDMSFTPDTNILAARGWDGKFNEEQFLILE
jgi:hypothetical protein